jgi:hypothetical protein
MGRNRAYTIRIFTRAVKSIAQDTAQATFASPSYGDVRTIGNKHAKFRIVGVEGAPQ